MDSLLTSISTVTPVLLQLTIGWLLRKLKWLREETTHNLNDLIFLFFLPVLLFNNIREMDLTTGISGGFPLAMGLALTSVFMVSYLAFPFIEKDPQKEGVMVQAMFRTSFSIMGIPLLSHMYGARGTAAATIVLPVLIVLNNIYAVIALSRHSGKRISIRRMVIHMVTNPLIISSALGLFFLWLNIRLPAPVHIGLKQIGAITSPLALIVLGASLKWQGVKDNGKQLILTVAIRQLLIPAVMFVAAYLLGYRNEHMAVMLVAFGCPVAIGAYPMAVAMGGDAQLAAGQVVLTTVGSMFSFLLLIWAGKALGML